MSCQYCAKLMRTPAHIIRLILSCAPGHAALRENAIRMRIGTGRPAMTDDIGNSQFNLLGRERQSTSCNVSHHPAPDLVPASLVIERRVGQRMTLRARAAKSPGLSRMIRVESWGHLAGGQERRQGLSLFPPAAEPVNHSRQNKPHQQKNDRGSRVPRPTVGTCLRRRTPPALPGVGVRGPNASHRESLVPHSRSSPRGLPAIT